MSHYILAPVLNNRKASTCITKDKVNKKRIGNLSWASRNFKLVTTIKDLVSILPMNDKLAMETQTSLDRPLHNHISWRI